MYPSYTKPTDKMVWLHARHKRMLAAMDKERANWFPHWRDVSDYFLPRRYPWLMSKKDARTVNRRNRKLLDSTSTLAVRTLASGMMNGVTSPARPWFNLRIAGYEADEVPHAVKLWLQTVTERLMLTLSESNFYNAMAVAYLEWCTFGTASMAIYEDYKETIRCYNFALGEFYISQDNTSRINRHGRRMAKTVEQLAQEFGLENLCHTTQEQHKRGGEALLLELEIAHLIEENADDELRVGNAPYRECYWEIGGEAGKYLAVRPVYEWPCVTPRWEIHGTDVYGTSPAMDALADVIQLQVMLLERGKGLAKQISPPMIVDQQLRNRPKALSANGITYAAAANQNFGAKEAYKVQVPLQAIAKDVSALQNRIRETCHNQLFNMISELDTVRSATEIDARREEKLVHLGPVLQRFYNEGLDPALKRVYGIMKRQGLLPEMPEELASLPVEVQYVSVLSDAQRASSTVTIERFLQFTGEISPLYPEAVSVPNVANLVRTYGKNLGIPADGLRSREEVEEEQAQKEQVAQLQQAVETGGQLAQGAKVLSDTDVGGGQSALAALTGG